MTQTTSTTEIGNSTGLAIEVIGRTGSIALVSGPRVLWHTDFGDRSGAAASIGSAIRAASQRVRLSSIGSTDDSMPSLDFVGVADGPGSFTGLRIAVTTANTLAYAAGVPVIGVDSLAAIAASADCHDPRIDPVTSHWLIALNAYRGQVYACDFPGCQSAIDYQTQAMQQPCGSQLLMAAQWDQWLATRKEMSRLAGDQALFAKVLSDSKCDGLWQASTCWAIGVGRIAMAIHQRKNSHPQTFTAVQPRYFRPSAAEEQMDLS